MAPLVNLISCSIIEKDWNGDVLWTWSYPRVCKLQKSYVTKKWNTYTKQDGVHSFVGARHADVWIYIHTTDTFAANKLPKVKRCGLVLFAKDFNPQDYQELCRILSCAYCESGEPARVLKHYLLAFSEGTADDPADDAATAMKKFNAQWQMNNNHAKKLVRTFELETILIYTALLLKKRIVVYHHSLEELLGWIETFPTLMKHRKVTESLFPWVDLVKDELSELKNYSYYVAGCRDSSVSSKPELFDLLVNIPAREISVASHAKESLTMTKAHKEIALFMVQLFQHDDDVKGDGLINEIAEKTQDLLSQLKTMARVQSSKEGKIFSPQSIREQRDLPLAVEHFFINLGIAENLFPIQTTIAES